MYATGLGIGKDMNKAQYWWKVAAENGDKDSLIAWMETVF
jgi:TPR repeat protein